MIISVFPNLVILALVGEWSKENMFPFNIRYGASSQST